MTNEDDIAAEMARKIAVELGYSADDAGVERMAADLRLEGEDEREDELPERWDFCD
jgi:hypothetical protein